MNNTDLSIHNILKIILPHLYIFNEKNQLLYSSCNNSDKNNNNTDNDNKNNSNLNPLLLSKNTLFKTYICILAYLFSFISIL